MRAVGMVEVRIVYGDRVLRSSYPQANALMNEGHDVLGRLLSGDRSVLPNMAYVEFYNGAGDPPSVVPDPVEGRSYYAGLEAADPADGIDYLRIPLIFGPAVGATAGHQSNRVRWTITTSGTEGVAGLSFSSGAGSKVFGGALVAAPDLSDRSADLVFARFYPEQPVEKGPANQQIQLIWTYTFE